MKLILLVITFAAFSAVCIAQDIGTIDWSVVEPVYQIPSFFQRFPFLLWIFEFFSPPPNNGIVSGGNEADRSQYPFMVGLIMHFNDGNGFCAGSLISTEYVLTAAHCVAGAASGIAILGAHYIKDGTEIGQQIYFFEEIIIHSGWNGLSLSFDIALVKLPEPVEYNQYIQPIRLPNMRQSSTQFIYRQASTIGWGRSLFNADWDVLPVLRYTQSHIIPDLLCRVQFPGVIDSVAHICSTSDSEITGPCPGDFGGPHIILEADNIPTQVAIATFMSGLGCERGRPAVFTLIGPFLSWIQDNTNIIIANDFEF